MTLDQLFDIMAESKSSDMYITVDAPCLIRVDGVLQPQGERLEQQGVESLLNEIMDEQRRHDFHLERESNFAVMRPSGRYRVSAFFQRELPGAVIRRIESTIPTIEELELPEIMKTLPLNKRGLVLVVGATGSGKSTSLAAMINHRNENLSGHILTVEDPIEFVHQHKKCIVTQREVGVDTESYEVALKNSLRQAPDMILIGEIRNRETMEYAMAFAETGHLCMATLHANNANQALERILHLVPKEKKDQFLFDLSLNLRGVIAQQLVRDKSGSGRHAVFEVLLNTPRVADLIRRGELHELKATMMKAKDSGMQTFDQSLFELLKEDKVTLEDALHSADSENDLRLMLKSLPNQQETANSLTGIRINMD